MGSERADRLYRLERIVRDTPSVLLSDAELQKLNERERSVTDFLRRHHTPAGATAPPDTFVPWSPEEQRRFVSCVRQVGADSRSRRELWAGQRVTEAPSPRAGTLGHVTANATFGTQVQLAHGTGRSSAELMLHYRLLLVHASEVVSRPAVPAALLLQSNLYFQWACRHTPRDHRHHLSLRLHDSRQPALAPQ